jgi:hypothetical protein
MLWESRLPTLKKIASSIILGAGIFVLVCAILKSIFVLVVSLDVIVPRGGAVSLIIPPCPQDPINGAQLAGEWGTREAFVAVITTNLPMIFPLLKSLLTPLFGSVLRSSQKTYKMPTGFRTIGGGGGDSRSRNRHRHPNANPITTNSTTFSGSEERIVDEVKMQDMKAFVAPMSDNCSPDGILVSNQVDVTHEDKTSRHGEHHLQRVHESW